MPDGTDLKAPEERMAHDLLVRANVALVFVKPAAYTPACCAFVKATLAATEGLVVLGESGLSGEAIAEGSLIDKHYAEIAAAALATDPSDLVVADDRKAAFQEAFGTAWDAAVADRAVLNARDCALRLGAASADGGDDEPLSARDLQNLWLAAPTKIKVAAGAYVAMVKGKAPGAEGDDDDDEAHAEAPLWVVDGFYPAMREAFVKPGAEIKLFVVGFDPKVLPWAAFRGAVVGATNPSSAAEGSLRKLVFDQWDALGLEAQPDNTDNAVHASAGPLEGLKERMTWLGFPLEADPTGKFLCELAVWDEAKRDVLRGMLDNPTVAARGGTGKAFDLTEDTDTADLYVFANNVAFAAELEN